MMLMASSTGTPAARGSGVGSFRSFRSFRSFGGLLCQAIEVFTNSGVHLLLHTTHFSP